MSPMMVLTRCLSVATALGMGASVRADGYVIDGLIAAGN